MRVFRIATWVGCLAAAACGGTVAPTESSAKTTSTASSAASTSTPASTTSPTTSTTYTGACEISASNYDQSCGLDSDCTLVSAGDYCSSRCLCGGSTINVGALKQFAADVAKTPLGSGALGQAVCGCPAEFSPCCRGGMCTLSCSAPADTLPACADAGGICMPPYAGCAQAGPPNSCAYADEPCCIVPPGAK